MNLLTIEHLTKSYTERLLFNDTAFSINEGEKVGLIGINGTGKSTLLRIAAGLEEPDGGTVVKGRSLYIRYLPQIPEFTPGDTILDSIVRDNKNEPHFSSVEELKASAKTMLNRLEIEDFDAKVETLSGGQRKRVALASVLLSTADLLILDEPTNHLDSQMADWLEGYLKAFKGALLMITHDRYFLDSVTNRIVELDKGKLYSYQGGYEKYLELKAERLSMAEAAERKRQSILRTEIAWMQRGARARSTKQKAHIQRYEQLRDQEGPEYDRNVQLESIGSRLGRTTVELKDICKSYGDKVLMKDFTYIFLKNDRVGIIGQNGSGKSTLMNRLVGERISIITSKAQTTRHRIIGIVNTADMQIVYSDTPGVLHPNYKLQESMLNFSQSALGDADVLLYVTDVVEKIDKNEEFLQKVQKVECPVLLLINKIDTTTQPELEKLVAEWKELLPKAEIIPISALSNFNIDYVKRRVEDLMPESPPYFEKDALTDKPARFFVTEIIREKILLYYQKEIPYAVEVVVELFKEEAELIHIKALIIVERDSQKGIIIGHRGQALKKVGAMARKDIERFFDKKVFLEMFVKVEKDWRNRDNMLKNFGYQLD